MSRVTDEILEKLKVLTLIEASELVSQIEEAFGVTARRPAGRIMMPSADNRQNESQGEKRRTTFTVVLESVADDKRVAALKVIRSLTNLGLKEAKDFCYSLPKVVKEGISKDEAEATKKELESAGGNASIKLLIRCIDYAEYIQSQNYLFTINTST